MGSPRVTLPKAAKGEPATFAYTPSFEGFNGVAAACRVMPAVAAEPRTQQHLVKANERDEKGLHHGIRSRAMTRDNATAPPHTKICWSRSEMPKARIRLAVASKMATIKSCPNSTPRLKRNSPPMNPAVSSLEILKKELNPRPWIKPKAVAMRYAQR